MKKTYTIDDLRNLLEITASQDPKAEKLLLQPVRGKTVYDYIIKECPDKPKLSSEVLYFSILDGMNDYLKGYQAPPSFRQKLWETCRSWTERITEQTCFTPEDTFDEYIPQPVAADTGIALIKKLHDENGVTKKDLQEKLGVDERTIRNNLRALCPELSEGMKIQKPLRIGGQEIRAKVEVSKDQNGQKTYRMKERLHPLILQLNTYQVCNLLQALQVMNETGRSNVSLDIALDIWCQLSESGKQRVIEKGSRLYSEFSTFAEELDSISEENVFPVFRTESDLENTSREDELSLAYKSGEPVNLTLQRDGKRESYHHYTITDRDPKTGIWQANCATETASQKNTIFFTTDEVWGYIERADATE